MSDDRSDRSDTAGAAGHVADSRGRIAGLIAYGAAGTFVLLLFHMSIASIVVLVIQVLAAKTGVVPPGLAIPILIGVLLVLLVLRRPAALPGGIVLPPHAAPDLYTNVDELSDRLGAPRIAGIVLDTRLGIGRVRVARLSSLGGFRTYLRIGLPLLLALPREPFLAMLAHELEHGRSGGGARALVHRQRSNWMQLSRWLPPRRFMTYVMGPFIRAFARRFAHRSLSVARQHEYAADRVAATLTKPDDLVVGLVRLRVVQRFMVERFHPDLLADFRRAGVAPSGLQARFERALRQLADDPRWGAWLDAAFDEPGHALDAHPALAHRLAALGRPDASTSGRPALLPLAFPDADVPSAARIYLAETARELALSLENVWIAEMRAALDDRHEELVRLEERRRQLDSRSDLSPSETLEHAIAVSETQGNRVAIPILRELVAANPDMAPAHFVLGTLLLRDNDADGIDHLETSMAADATLVAPACEIACEFMRAHGRHDFAEAYARRFGVTAARANGPRSRNGIPAIPDAVHGVPAGSPVFLPHGLDRVALLAVKRRIAPVAAVARAYFVRTPLPAGLDAFACETRIDSGDGTGEPEYLLAVELMRGRFDGAAVAERLAREVAFPGRAAVMVIGRRNRELRDAIATVDDSLLFQRTTRRVA